MLKYFSRLHNHELNSFASRQMARVSLLQFGDFDVSWASLGDKLVTPLP